MVLYGSIWSCMVLYGPEWSRMVPNQKILENEVLTKRKNINILFSSSPYLTSHSKVCSWADRPDFAAPVSHVGSQTASWPITSVLSAKSRDIEK